MRTSPYARAGCATPRWRRIILLVVATASAPQPAGGIGPMLARGVPPRAGDGSYSWWSPPRVRPNLREVLVSAGPRWLQPPSTLW